MKGAQKAPIRALTLLLAVFLLFGGPARAADADSVTITGVYNQTEARTMLQMVNDYRVSASDAWYYDTDSSTKIYCPNLKPLTYDYTLEKIAMQRAAEIAHTFSHQRPNGGLFSSLDPSGTYQYRSENIAFGNKYETSRNMMGLDPTFDASLPGYKDYGWMETNESYANQGHRRNIFSDKVTCIGVGHFVVGSMHYWVQEFGNPAADTTVTPANDSIADVKISLTLSEEEIVYPFLLSIADIYATRSTKQQIQRLVFPSNYNLTFRSGNSRKVAINKAGKITIAPNFVGVVTINVTGTANGDPIKPTSFKVTVRPPAPPLPGLTAAKNRRVTAKWGRDSRVNGYQIQFSRDSNFKTVAVNRKITNNKTVSYTTKALSKGKYYVRVRSYKKVGSNNVCSLWRNRSIQVK